MGKNIASMVKTTADQIGWLCLKSGSIPGNQPVNQKLVNEKKHLVEVQVVQMYVYFQPGVD